MSNYSTSYNVTQGGDLFAIQDNANAPGTSRYGASKGTTVQSPLNYRKLNAFKHIDNEFFFFIKNQDRKIFQIHGMEFYATFVERSSKSRLFAKKCQTIDPEQGSLRLVVNPGDIAHADTGNYDVVLTYTDGRGLNLPLYADVNYRPNLICEISEAAHAVPLTTDTVDTFTVSDNDPLQLVSERTFGPHYYHKRRGLITLAVYATNYSGKFFLQGSLSDYPDTTDWFNIELGAILDHHLFSTFTGVEPFSIRSNVKWIRTRHDTGTGTVDKVVFRL